MPDFHYNILSFYFAEYISGCKFTVNLHMNTRKLQDLLAVIFYPGLF